LSLSQASAPLASRIPASDFIGVTVILLTCSYNEQEFVRIGYYVNTEFEEGVLKQEWDQAQLDPTLAAPDPSAHLGKLVRNVLANKPRVTKFNIKW
jgi:histone chaperone ASF1